MANFRYREQLDYLYSVSVGVVIQVLALTGTLGPVLWPSPSPPNLAILYSLFNPKPVLGGSVETWKWISPGRVRNIKIDW